jgi:hypothetical protein
MWRSGQPPVLQCEPAVDHRRGVDPRHDGLRHVPQRAWGRLALRRILLGLDTRRQLHGAHRFRCDFQLELQGVPTTDVGSTGEPFFLHAVLHHVLTGGKGNNVREGQWVDHVDVENGAGG